MNYYSLSLYSALDQNVCTLYLYSADMKLDAYILLKDSEEFFLFIYGQWHAMPSKLVQIGLINKIICFI
jgi:hypothetical protein